MKTRIKKLQVVYEFDKGRQKLEIFYLCESDVK